MASRTTAHVVKAGESLWTISRLYGCGVDELRTANRLENNKLLPGDELQVPSCQGGAGDGGSAAETTARPSPLPAGAFMSHTVESGDTLGKIAKLYDTSVDDLRERNGIAGTVIQPGQVLAVMPGARGTGKPIPGQSVGSVWHGRLVRPTQLPRSPHYYRRRLERTYGTNYLIHHIKRVTARVRRLHRTHTLAIGDISAARGGPITEHVSHRSGRDVDLGLYFKKVPKGYPEEFVRATTRTLAFEPTWTLLTSLAATAEQDGGIEVMFLGYDVQRILYREAKKRGVKAEVLSKLLQFPRGRGAQVGLVRHEPAHDDHIHVRFKCPDADDDCE